MSDGRAEDAAGTTPGVEGAPVWLVTDVYPPDCGGSGWSAHALARTLADRDHDIEVIGIDPQAVGITQRVFEGIPITEIGVASARRSPWRRLGADDYAHARVASYLADRLAADPGVRVLHAQHLHSGSPSAAAAAGAGCASVQTLRDYWPVCLHGTSWWNGAECEGCSVANLRGCMHEYWGWPAPLARLMVPWARRRLAARRRGVEAMSRVITVSDWVRRRVEREIPRAGYEVVFNIVDADEVRAQAVGAERATGLAPGEYLAAAGKLVATKGFDRMLAALADTGAEYPLVIAGSGPERDALERQAAALGLQVELPGWIDHARLLRLIADSRAFLLPSAWSEPLSRLLLEAMALGVPLITWRSGGNPEPVTDGVDAFVVDDAAQLGAALAALNDRERRARIGEAAERLAREKFSPAAVYPQVAAVYAAAIADSDQR